MQTVEFITIDDMSKPPSERKATVWCRTNTLKGFRDFMQYVLDSCERPQEFMVIDVGKDLAYDMYRLATEQFGMRKRSFHERMENIQTGCWTKKTLAA